MPYNLLSIGKAPASLFAGALAILRVVVTVLSVEGVALELFDEFAELGRETVHGALEARQEIERHDDREAYGRNRGQEILFHLASSCQVVRDGPGRGWRWRCRLGSGKIG